VNRSRERSRRVRQRTAGQLHYQGQPGQPQPRRFRWRWCRQHAHRGRQLHRCQHPQRAHGPRRRRLAVQPADDLDLSGGGSTSIGVNNAGGTGALTVADAILLVQAANGATTAQTAFRLAGPVSAGAFDYFLFPGVVSLGSQNSWFLHSSVPPAPPPDVHPVPPPTPAPFTPPLPPPPPPGAPPIPLFRPEVAVQSVLPSIAARWALVTLGTFNEHQGDSFSCAAI
jgi:hypothetical protein